MSKIKFSEYDVVICGAGPAGLKMACELQNKSSGAYKVLLLDKKKPWQEPVFCAEAVSADRLSEFWPLKEQWIRRKISGIYFTSPSRDRAEFYSKDCGLILNRALFHKDMADTASSMGVEVHFDALCRKVKKTADGDGAWSLEIHSLGETLEVKTQVIIDATGPGSKLSTGVPELAGMEAGDADLESGVFAVVDGVEHSPEHIELFFGSDFPGGYGWLFPRDGGEVNLGFVLGRSTANQGSSRDMLLKFINEYFPTAQIKGIYGGMIACGQSKKMIAKSGFFKIGDAASCVNPISRSGIVEAIQSAAIASASVLEWLESKSATERLEIERVALDNWINSLGSAHLQLANGKKAFSEVTDKQFNRAAKRLSRLPKEKTSLIRIFFAVLFSSPSLIWKLRSFIR
ncbi:MAG TPA: NAD(P)/FAD-dependent oxidoreductase [Fibrobacter sp.]|nr:NAD(P)/FAD-dependent oxidoreductase [Fibrobacter sp.]